MITINGAKWPPVEILRPIEDNWLSVFPLTSSAVGFGWSEKVFDICSDWERVCLVESMVSAMDRNCCYVAKLGRSFVSSKGLLRYISDHPRLSMAYLEDRCEYRITLTKFDNNRFSLFGE